VHSIEYPVSFSTSRGPVFGWRRVTSTMQSAPSNLSILYLQVAASSSFRYFAPASHFFIAAWKASKSFSGGE